MELIIIFTKDISGQQRNVGRPMLLYCHLMQCWCCGLVTALPLVWLTAEDNPFALVGYCLG